MSGTTTTRVFQTTNATAATPSWTSLTCASPAYPVFSGRCCGCWSARQAPMWSMSATAVAMPACGASLGRPTYTSIGGGLPASPVRGIARHPTQATAVRGYRVGLFISETSAPRKSASDGPANVSVEDLTWTAGNTLVAATHGRGVFTAVIPAPRIALRH